MKRLFILLFSFIIIFGCVGIKQSITPQEIKYRNKAFTYPTTFTVPTSNAEESWARAQSFVAQYSTMKIQTVTQYILQTYTPTRTMEWGYNVTRSPIGDKTQFSVQGFAGNMFDGKLANRNASILAYYMATGELQERFITR